MFLEPCWRMSMPLARPIKRPVGIEPLRKATGIIAVAGNSMLDG
jgi:phage repressor protein C with HTH and peptisase S24 domain